MESWKSEKIKSISNEVKELHPLLDAIFKNNETIAKSEYTHGQNEMGADFVLSRIDATLGDENYIGVIAKCGSIKQDYQEIKKQIEECSVERYFDAKKKIYLNEIWIVCNGTISNGAERKIHEEFKSRNIKFIDGDKLYKLIDKHYPYFWNEIPSNLGVYLTDTLIETTKAESYGALNATTLSINVNQDLYEIEKRSAGAKSNRFNKSLRNNLETAIDQNNLIIVEGGMGCGKTTLFRRYVRSHCEPAIFQREKILPQIIHCSDAFNDIETNLTAIVSKLESIHQLQDGNRIVLFLDGADEVKYNESSNLISNIKYISDFLRNKSHIKIVIGSRPVWTIEEGEEILSYARRFKVLPLSVDQIYRVIQQNCSSLDISDKLRRDLAKSALMRALPRTPMSAILLTRVLSANAKEIPQTLPELYSKYVELALGRWDIAKGLMTEREYPVILTFLSIVSKYMLDHGLQTMAISEVIQMLQNYTKTRQGLPDPQEIFSKISARSEVIHINNETKTFSFRHKSIAEFLLAQYQKDNYGKGAKFTNPFEGYWLGVEYFYLGLIQDAGQRIDRLSELKLSSERERVLRLLNFGNLMLASYQTEYDHIERAVYKVFTDMTEYFNDVKTGNIKSSLAGLPELQFIAALTHALQDCFEYPYFQKALDAAQIQCQCDENLTSEDRYISSFFIDSVRAGLKEKDVFKFLADADINSLPWAIKLGIQHIINDEKIDNDKIERLTKRISKSRKGNPALQKYIKGLYMTPMTPSQEPRTK